MFNFYLPDCQCLTKLTPRKLTSVTRYVNKFSSGQIRHSLTLRKVKFKHDLRIQENNEYHYEQRQHYDAGDGEKTLVRHGVFSAHVTLFLGLADGFDFSFGHWSFIVCE
jgi:hypothetical protein